MTFKGQNSPQGNPPGRAFKRTKRTLPKETRDNFQQEEHRKCQWKPGTMLSPLPVIMVSCGGTDGIRPNIITLAWTGTVCSEPPMVSISMRKERYSYDIIAQSKEFVINLTTSALAKATDWCGVRSGRDVDKFAEMGLTAAPSTLVQAPLIAESPVNLECKVRKIIPLGSHDLFLAEIVAVHVSEALVDKRAKLRLEHADLIAYSHGEYYLLGKKIGYFGYSVKKQVGSQRKK